MALRSARLGKIAPFKTLSSEIQSIFSAKSDFWLLGGIWLGGALCDRLWLARDRAIPAWDQTHHLTGSLNYLHALQQAQWFSGQWWRSFWMLSSKNPPFSYIATALFQHLFGPGPDRAMFVMLLFSAILLCSIYGLGKHLFNRRVGLIAALICLFMPSLYFYRLQYLLDYPLTALITASFWCLTVWHSPALFQERKSSKQWLWALGLGLSVGLAALTKQSVLFFLLVPLAWVSIRNVQQRNWRQVTQLIVAFVLAGFIFLPWYRTNWIYFIGNYQSGIAAAAVQEGDPPLNDFAAWTYYFEQLPDYISWPLLIISLVGLILSLIQGARKKARIEPESLSALKWLAFLLIPSYFLCSALVNKDSRYILPVLPIFALVLAYGLSQLPDRWRVVRWGTLGFTFLLMVFNLFPLGGTAVSSRLRSLHLNAEYYPYTGVAFPHAAIVSEIIRTSPQLQATVGVMPVTAILNHNNFNYYGALANFQVYGREVGMRDRHVEQDARSLDWFLTKTGDRGTDKPSNLRLVGRIEQSPEFKRQKTWPLPDNSTVSLYHRTPAPITVISHQSSVISNSGNQEIAISSPSSNIPPSKIHLDRVTVPPVAPPGKPVPVTYTWSGPWQQLQSGIVLITWKLADNAQNPHSNRWLHDRAIADGKLHSGQLSAAEQQQDFQVSEQTAMLPPATVTPGTYSLEVTYLNRETGESYPIAAPPVALQIDPKAPVTPAPELDLVTQLRSLAANLPQGIPALDPVFDEIGRINQYDPVQDYTQQAELALSYRLQAEPNNLEWAYALAFSQVLQEDADGAIASLQNVVRLDPQNPYAHAYLAFVNLYQWQAKAAQKAIQPAIALQPNSPEIQAIDGVAALMKGNFVKAWRTWQKLAPLIQ